DRAGGSGREMAAGELTRAEERAVEGDVDDAPPRVRRHVLGGHREVRRRVVDQDVWEPEPLLGHVEGGDDLAGIADGALDRDDPSTERAEGLAARVEVLRPEAGDVVVIC